VAKAPGQVVGGTAPPPLSAHTRGPLGNINAEQLIAVRNTSMKKRNLTFLSVVLIAIIYIVATQVFGNKRDKRNFDIFYNSEISGSVNLVEIKYHGVGFRVLNDSNEYVFYPFTRSDSEKKIFYQFATRGDSILKPRYHDTLILIKEGRRYQYTFRKF
jgi:hypothetical protein